MNTKQKIMGAPEVVGQLGNSPAILVIGSFDPLQAVHADRLNKIAQPGVAKLVAAVTDPIDTVLSWTARKEMVAALGVVDFVMPYEPGVEHARRWAAIHNDSEFHDRWSTDFKKHVRRRSQAISA